MRIVVSEKSAICSAASDGLLLTELDRPTSGLCIETKEFILLWNMLVVTVEERYADAGFLSVVFVPPKYWSVQGLSGHPAEGCRAEARALRLEQKATNLLEEIVDNFSRPSSYGSKSCFTPLKAKHQTTLSYGILMSTLSYKKVPIQVNKDLAYTDGMRIVESEKLAMRSAASDDLLFTMLERYLVAQRGA